MKKKYQVFVSSTLEDLREERSAVMQCLLEMGCIPVGMEYFPSSNMSQMEYIETMMDDCDYYILILAGRYGTVDSDGVSFTEREYDYAVKKKIPVLSFVLRNPEKLTDEKRDQTEELRKKLQDFRAKVCSGRVVRFYTDIRSLEKYVLTSLSQCIIDFPAIGWVRGSSVAKPDSPEQSQTQIAEIP